MSDKIADIDSDFDEMVDDMSKLDERTSKGSTKGKNGRSTVEAYGINFDSKEELEFHEWVLEAQSLGFIESFSYQPTTFVLFEGEKNTKGKYTIRPHVYSPDYHIIFTDKWVEFRRKNKLKVFDKFDEKDVYVDVKSNWNPHSGDREFSLNMKWCYYRYHIYVHKVKMPNFFKQAWLPKNCVFTRKTHKVSMRFNGIKTFSTKYA